MVSSFENNAVMPTLTVAPLTSSMQRIYPFEVFIGADEIGLPRDSGLHNLKVQLQTMLLVDQALKLHLGL